MMRRLVLALAAALAAGPAPRAAPLLRAGAHAVDIVPCTLPVRLAGGFFPIPGTRVEGRMRAQALALDDGSTRVVIAVADTLMMPRELLDRAKAAASAFTGIPASHMLISATHTHSAPAAMGALGTDAVPEYAAFLESRLVEAIQGAVRNLEPARVGWTSVQDPAHTHCRQWILRSDKIRKDPFGALTVRSNMHPGYQNPDFIGPAGPSDPELSLLAFQSSQGRPIALLANYSMHYVGRPAGVVSADYYGIFAEILEQRIPSPDGARPFLAMMSQGTSGDQHWMDYSKPKVDMDPRRFAEALAGITFSAYQGIRYHDSAPLAVRESRLTLRRRTPDAARLAWARQLVSRTGPAGPRTLPEVYARQQIFLAEEPVRELKLQALRIGDLGIAAFPCEVFAITGLKIKGQSPLAPTFNIELANGAEGYIPPPEQHVLGGYTTWPARSAGLEAGAEPRIVETLLGLLEEVSGRPRRPVRETDGPYARAVLASKPLAYWRGGEFAGPSAIDRTGHGNTARYEDGVVFYLDGPASAAFSGAGINRSPHFAGGRMTARLKDLGDAYTVELWFWNGLPAGVRPVTGYLFSRGEDRLAIDGAGKLAFEGAGARLEGRTGIQPKTWYHVMLARSPAAAALYLNGLPQIHGNAGAVSRADQVSIAGARDQAATFEGKIDEIAIYPRALSAKEAARHYALAVAGQRASVKDRSSYEP